MTLESKENYPRHTKTVQNSLGFISEVKPLHKPSGDLVLLRPYVGAWDTLKGIQHYYTLHRLSVQIELPSRGSISKKKLVCL